MTGGSRGIGFGVAKCLARENYNVAIGGVRDIDQVQTAVAELSAAGGDILYCRADVSEAAARRRMLEEIRERFGCLHVLVNNAGVAPDVRADVLEASEASYERVMRINLQGPYFLTQAVANWMVEQKNRNPAYEGCIITVTSISAAVASPSRGEYCISKAGLSMATQLFAVRLAEYDIPVYEIRPGITLTDMTSGVMAKYDKLIGEGVLLQPRWGEPEDTGKAVAMLCRGEMPYSTGQIINTDGGFMVQRL